MIQSGSVPKKMFPIIPVSMGVPRLAGEGSISRWPRIATSSATSVTGSTTVPMKAALRVTRGILEPGDVILDYLRSPSEEDLIFPW